MNDLNCTTIAKEEKEAMGKSIELEKLLVPVGLKHQFEQSISVFQAQLRTDPQYIEALHEAVVLPDSFCEADDCDDDDEAIDWETSATYFAKFDQLIEVYKDQSALPKKLVNLLLTSFADVVLKAEGDEASLIAEDSSIEMFVNNFYERIGKLTGCNDYEGIRP
jgi:hypothetical protein